MQIKYFYAEDNSIATGIYYAVLKTEEVDSHFFSKLGLGPDTKIILEFSGCRVAASCGKDFTPWYYENSVRDRSQKVSCYLSDLVGLYLDSVDHLREIPAKIDLKEIAELYRINNNEYFSVKTNIEKLYEEEDLVEGEQYKKVLYKERDRYVFGIINSKLEFVSRRETNDEKISADYLWCQFEKISDYDWNSLTKDDIFMKSAILI